MSEPQNIYIPYDKYFVTFTCDKAEDRPLIQAEANRYIDAVKSQNKCRIVFFVMSGALLLTNAVAGVIIYVLTR